MNSARRRGVNADAPFAAVGRLLAAVVSPFNRFFRAARMGGPARWIAAALGTIVFCVVGLYLAILSGLLSIDAATPWIVSALEEKLPPGHRVQIGKTRLDYDSAGAPVLTVEDLVVRNSAGDEIVRAPSAVVGLEAGSLLLGNYRARRIDLNNAVMIVRLNENGGIMVSPTQSAQAVSPVPAARPQPKSKAPAAAPPSSEPFKFPEFAAWLDNLERTGLDGIALAEVGLIQGTLVVENDSGTRSWRFNNINTSLRRPANGGFAFLLSSGDRARPWQLNITIGPGQSGVRAIDIIADRVVPNDLIFAAGLGETDVYADTPISGLLRAQISTDGKLISGLVRAGAGKGSVGSAIDELGRFAIDEAQLQVRFEPQKNAIVVDPFQVSGGQNVIVLGAVIQAPQDASGIWPVIIPQGQVALATGRSNEPKLNLDRILVRGGFDPKTKRLTFDEGRLQGPTANVALSGGIDLAGDDPMIQLGLAATRMPVSALKRLWPAPISPGTRSWVLENVDSGIVERLVLALNVPLDALGKPNVALPHESVKLEIEASGARFRVLQELPPITDARAFISVTGRSANIRITQGVVELGNKRKLAIPEGTLEVPDHSPRYPNGTIKLKLEGSADALAELLANDLIKNETGFAIDPDTTKGSTITNLRLDLPFKRDLSRSEVTYSADVDVTGLTAENLVRGQKIENGSAKIAFSAGDLRVKGEGRLGGAPATFEYRKARNKPESEFRIAATLDDSARARFGIDLGAWLRGPVVVRAHGNVNDRETRVNVDADLTGAQVAELVPGWNKAAGRTARAIYKMTERDGVLRFEDVNISGSGVSLRGSFELDADGNLNGANFSNFHLSDGDKATLRADRAADGALKVVVRGNVLDSRGLLRSLSDGPADRTKKQKPSRDLDVDIRLGAATGNNGEVIRNIELRFVRRNSEIRSFALIGKIGRDSSIVGELRARDGGRPVIYVTAGDAGAVFRFADYYGKIQGGEIWIVLDTPRADGSAQDGIVSVRDFNIVGEPNLDRLQSAAPAQEAGGRPGRGGSVSFVRMRIDFTRTPGNFAIKEALIYGPTIGATVDGVLNFAENNVSLRGTYIPAYGLNNLFGRLPLVGMFLGGPKEGLIAITFEIVGPASGPVLRVNPMSMAAPGFFRKIFEFRGAQDVPPAAPLRQ